MKNRFASLRSLALLALLGLVLAGVTGCSSDEPSNTSEKPWNSPEGWQNGNLPSMMTQPH